MKISAVLVNTLLLFALNNVQAELLGHISEDDTQAAPPSVATPQNDRKIIYRVICAPDGEKLPDCEQPATEDTAAITVTPDKVAAEPVLTATHNDNTVAKQARQQPVTPAKQTHQRHPTSPKKSVKLKKAKPTPQHKPHKKA